MLKNLSKLENELKITNACRKIKTHMSKPIHNTNLFQAKGRRMLKNLSKLENELKITNACRKKSKHP